MAAVRQGQAAIRASKQSVQGAFNPVQNLFIRTVDARVVQKMKTASRARGLGMADYIAKLAILHERARQLSDNGNKDVTAMLDELGLQSVSV